MNSFWHARPTLVTGGTGLLGRHLVERLLESGAEVVCLARNVTPGPIRAARHSWPPSAAMVRGDVRDQGLVERILRENEILTVFHLAAQARDGRCGQDPTSTFETNIRGTWSVLEACRRCPRVSQVIALSSERVYQQQDDVRVDERVPLDGRLFYDASQSCADLIVRSYAQTYDVPVAIARFGNLFGGGDLNWQRIVPGTIRAAHAAVRPIIRSDGFFIRDYLSAEEGAFACTLLAERLAHRRELRGEAFNFSYELNMSVLDLVQEILRLMHVDLVPQVLNTSRRNACDLPLCAEKARRLLGYRPMFSLQYALSQTIDWYQTFLEQGSWTMPRFADLAARPA